MISRWRVFSFFALFVLLIICFSLLLEFAFCFSFLRRLFLLSVCDFCFLFAFVSIHFPLLFVPNVSACTSMFVLFAWGDWSKRMFSWEFWWFCDRKCEYIWLFGIFSFLCVCGHCKLVHECLFGVLLVYVWSWPCVISYGLSCRKCLHKISALHPKLPKSRSKHVKSLTHTNRPSGAGKSYSW